jgi:hypothetical protein
MVKVDVSEKHAVFMFKVEEGLQPLIPPPQILSGYGLCCGQGNC